MGLSLTPLNIGEYIKADGMWYGVDRTEGGLGLKIPVRTELMMQKTLEAQLVLNVAADLIDYCRRANRGIRKIQGSDDLEIDRVCGENPANAGLRIIDAAATMRDPFYLKVHLNKTFGINQLSVTWGMCSDESLLVHYMEDLRKRLLNGGTAGIGAETPVTAEAPKEPATLVIMDHPWSAPETA